MKKLSVWLLLLLFTVGACAEPQPLLMRSPTAPVYAGTLEPYRSATPLPVTRTIAATPSPFPTLTPTPRLHSVRLGETLLGIALRFGLSLQELQEANPDIDPNILIVGQVLVIPPIAQEPTAANPTPTPQPLALSETACFRETGGGLWCLLSAQVGPSGAENVVVEVNLRGADGGANLQAIATSLLDHVPQDTRLPLAAWFSPQRITEAGLQPPYQAQASLLTALPLLNPEGRYLPAEVIESNISYHDDRSRAEISGEIRLLPESPAPAGRVWLLAAAYDAQERLIGLRRWEYNQELLPGGSLPFQVRLFSMENQPIDRIGIFVEAVP